MAAFPASEHSLFAQLRLFIALEPVDSRTGRPGIEPQILAATGVTVGSPTLDGGSTDQANLGPIPRSFIGRGIVELRLFIDGIPTNVVLLLL